MSINVFGSAQVACAQQNHLSNRSTSAIMIVSPALQLFHSKQNNILIALLRRVALDSVSYEMRKFRCAKWYGIFRTGGQENLKRAICAEVLSPQGWCGIQERPTAARRPTDSDKTDLGLQQQSV